MEWGINDRPKRRVLRSELSLELHLVHSRMIEMIWLTSPERITERAQHCQALFFSFPWRNWSRWTVSTFKEHCGRDRGLSQTWPKLQALTQTSGWSWRIIIHVHREMLRVHFGHENTQNLVVHEVITKLGEEALSYSAVQRWGGVSLKCSGSLLRPSRWTRSFMQKMVGGKSRSEEFASRM